MVQASRSSRARSDSESEKRVDRIRGCGQSQAQELARSIAQENARQKKGGLANSEGSWRHGAGGAQE